MNPIKSLIRRIKIKKYRKNNCIFYTNNVSRIDLNNFNEVYFILNNKTYFHYGDLMFYIPAILFLSKIKKVNVIINKSEELFMKHFISNNKNIIFTDKELEKKTKSLIITFPYNIKDYDCRYTNIIGLGLPDQAIKKKYPLFLLSQLFLFFNKTIDEKKYYSIVEIIKNNLLNKESYFDELNLKYDKKYLLFSPYMNSGWWRDLFKIKKNKLVNIANTMAKKNNLSIILVGSKLDEVPSNLLNFIDLRGVSIEKIISICKSENIIMGIGYDNIWMHIFDLISKKYHVLFRGRIKKINYDNHINSINVSFYNKDVKDSYL